MFNIKLYRHLFLFIFFILLVGICSTYIHFINKTINYQSIFKLNINLILMNLLIVLGLLIRFFKWHLFLRLCNIRIKIRRSFTIFFASLFFNLFFPLMLGEILMKNYFLKKEGYDNQTRNISLIIFERLLDFLSIIFLSIIFLCQGLNPKIDNLQNFLIISLSVIVALLLFLVFTFRIKISFKLIICFLMGLTGWSVIYFIYFATPFKFRTLISFSDFGYIFSNYLIFYPATSMGIFLSSNYLLISLEKLATETFIFLQTIINIRICSVAPTFIIGLLTIISLIKKRRQSEKFHFDEISSEYSDMIPEHIRKHLIERKCSMIIDNLKANASNKLIGLDLGGGKGWYTSRIIDLTGAKIILVERSLNQALDAIKRDPRIKTVIADMQYLPFKESSIDFGFSINAFHHLDNQDAQLKAFNSFSYVLKNKHNFFLHEMNVHNIFFRIYMNYFFPLIKSIDEGIECWIDPNKNKFGNFVSNNIIYFTFAPDFISSGFLKLLMPLERKLENSSINKYSAHYFRIFENIKEKT